MTSSARVLLAGSLLALLAPPTAAGAGPADVTRASAVCEEDVCVFAVTVRHGDKDLDHFADRYEVLGPDDELLGTRVLSHPHVDEQPFTRRLPGIRIPAGVARVRVRAHDSVHGFAGADAWVDLPAEPVDRIDPADPADPIEPAEPPATGDATSGIEKREPGARASSSGGAAAGSP